MSVRGALSLLAVAFGLYISLRGLMQEDPVTAGEGASVVLSIVTVIAAVAAPSQKRDRLRPCLPLPVTISVFAVSAVLPPLVTAANPGQVPTSVSISWYIGACGLLLTVLTVRRRPMFGLVGLVVLIAESVLLMGLVQAFTHGISGSILWVVTANVVVRLVDKLFEDTLTLTDIERAAAAWRSSQTARQRERRVRIRTALQVAGPVLTRVIERDGHLSQDDRRSASLAEATLRDEMRGGVLLDDAVRSAIAGCRQRGCAVSIVDDGGMAGLTDDDAARVRTEVARALAGATASSIMVRSTPHPEVAATVVGRQSAPHDSDDDTVTVWLEIARTPPQATDSEPGNTLPQE